MYLFTPSLYFKSITDVSFEVLNKIGVKGLILDVDDTLAPFRSSYIAKDIIKWVNNMKKSSIKMIIVSNNYKDRVKIIADKLGLQCIFFACKPLPFGIMAAAKRMNLNLDRIASVGDQIFTDVLASNFASIKSILINPLSKPQCFQMRLKRVLEKSIKRHIHQK